MGRIELKNIDKYYGTNHVLKNLNLTIEDGDFMTLLGPSGCGKTTTLRIISGLEKPQNGTMTMDGKEVINADDAFFLEPGKRELNLVFQSYALWPHMTVFDNVAFGLKIKKMKKEQIKTQVMDALEKMRIAQYADRYPSELSGGQQQRVAIARALALDPDILCFDEPTSALDPELTQEVLSVIRDLAAEGHTMIVVTHEMSFAREVAGRILYMAEGEILCEGTPAQVFADARVRAFAGDDA